MPKLSFLVAWIAASLAAWVMVPADCANTSVGIAPLTEQAGNYLDDAAYPPGLYPGGNTRPAAHELAGVAQAAQVVPRLADGTPHPNGRVGVLLLGMSNARQVASALQAQWTADLELSRRLRLVNACKDGQTLDVIAPPDAGYWTYVAQVVTASGLTVPQVQVAWVMEALRYPNDWQHPPAWPNHVDEAEGFWIDVLHNVRTLYPSVQLAYLDVLQYQGYAQNKSYLDEPFAFEQAFAAQRVLARQIAGDPTLAIGSASPWLSWGAYFWCDGTTPRADGHTWRCPQDAAGDGVHLTYTGAHKLATLLRLQLKADPTAVPWFLVP